MTVYDVDPTCGSGREQVELPQEGGTESRLRTKKDKNNIILKTNVLI